MNLSPPNIAGLLGIKGATVVAGFAGAVVSLSFVKELSRTQMLVAVATGTVAAAYLTPLTASFLGLSPELQNGLAFVGGLTAMNVIPGILKLTEWFRKEPFETMEHLPIVGFFFKRSK